MTKHAARLCDDEGKVSDEKVYPPHPFAPNLTYRGLLNNLRHHSGLPPYQGEPFVCTGSAHLAGTEFICTSPAHNDGVPLLVPNVPAAGS